jgi:hypothetical protein
MAKKKMAASAVIRIASEIGVEAHVEISREPFGVFVVKVFIIKAVFVFGLPEHAVPAVRADTRDEHLALIRRQIGESILDKFPILPIEIVNFIDFNLVSLPAEGAIDNNANFVKIFFHGINSFLVL